jgi:hypothetical protein
MRDRSRAARELTLELKDADELFVARDPDVASGMPGLPSGIDRIRQELDTRPLPGSLAAVIVLPAANVTPSLAWDIGRAVESYCEMGITSAKDDIRRLRREGIQTMIIGLSLFAAFVSIAETVVRTGLPQPVKDFLGSDGLFLVVGWVGLWYPIETLIYTPRPHHREIAMLRVIRTMRVDVRAAD